MAQFDFGTLDPATVSGMTLASDLTSWRDALNSAHAGTAAPTYAIAGMSWLDNSATPWALKRYDGASWITLGTIDPTTHAWTPANAAAPGANADITSLSGLTTALSIAQGGTGAATASNARANLGLGSAALLTAGTGAGNAVQLDANGQLPAVSGALLTNMPNSLPAQSSSNAGAALVTDGNAASWRSSITDSAEYSMTGLTSKDFTAIPSWARRITLKFRDITLTSSTLSPMLVQIGTSAGIETSEYAGATTGSLTYKTPLIINASTGILVTQDMLSAYVVQGSVVIEKCASGNSCIMKTISSDSSTARAFFGTAQKTLSATLDRVRLTTVSGTATYNAGYVSIGWE